MADENRRGKLEIPRLTGDALEFAETILSIGMPYDYAVQAFLDSFPAYAEHDELTEKEIYEALDKRFRRMRGDTRRASYHKIKGNEATLKQFLDVIPIASPFLRLIELEKMRQDAGLKCEQRLKVLSAAAKEVERLLPRERTSPFRGFSTLPDLPMLKDGDPPDPFGGAMMGNVNKRQENEIVRKGNAFGGAMMENATIREKTPDDS